jgi:hypothetical protein
MKTQHLTLLLALIPLLGACSQSPATSQDNSAATATSQANSMEIIELPELQPYLAASVKGDTTVTWTAITSSPQPPGNDQAGQAVQAAIKSQATDLAGIDYSALSIPAYVTVTRSLKLSPGDFTGDQLRVDSTGSVSGADRWALYSWQGPQIAQLPDRPQVTRWVQVYALYDLKEKKVVRLMATVRGQANE